MLKKRAQLLQQLRAFFYGLNVLEVDVPVLASDSVTDPNLDAISCHVGSATRYLQTSPEFFMKRLLAMGSGDIFYLGKAFRQDEQGSRHRPEFTMLEWYRSGFTDEDLIKETLSLLAILSPATPAIRLSYQQIFHQCTGLNPHVAAKSELQAFAVTAMQVDFKEESRNFWLDLIFSFIVEPRLPDGIVVIEDYPASQAALARTAKNTHGLTTAKRFEIFWDRLELANGYWELTDADEQVRRFAQDNKARELLGKPLQAIDPKGIALGVDRLLMRLEGCENIALVMPFADG
jgi:elongation factor P--(R)-beta-lysine ligase